MRWNQNEQDYRGIRDVRYIPAATADKRKNESPANAVTANGNQEGKRSREGKILVQHFTLYIIQWSRCTGAARWAHQLDSVSALPIGTLSKHGRIDDLH